jgi:hypothetical protein
VKAVGLNGVYEKNKTLFPQLLLSLGEKGQGQLVLEKGVWAIGDVLYQSLPTTLCLYKK